MFKLKRGTIGIFGGSFDPPHRGHLEISKISLKKIKLKTVYWVVTKKNPFKKKSHFDLNKRIKLSKNLTKKQKYIEIRFLEKKISSNKTINLIRHIKNKNRKKKIYFLLGADNLINFHKWKDYKIITKLCIILVFDRTGYKSKALTSKSYIKYNKKHIKFIKFNKVNISSSQLRKI